MIEVVGWCGDVCVVTEGSLGSVDFERVHGRAD